MVRKHFIFFGAVQGVGFRFHACHKARSLGLTGWVTNLYDGSVEMEVQGSEPLIGELLSYLRRQPFVNIESMETGLLPVIEERDFRSR